MDGTLEAKAIEREVRSEERQRVATARLSLRVE